MRILFSHSYYYKLDPKQWANQQPYPPLGTIFAAAWMREHGHEVALFDTCLRDRPDEIEAEIERFKPDMLVLYDDGFNYLTKMCLTNMREAAFKMIGIGKRHGCTVAVSSSDSTDHFEKYHQAGADFVMLGEAELTLKALVDALVEGSNTEEVNGLTAQTASGIKNTGRRPVLRELDTLPQPAWDLVDVAAYKRIWMAGNGRFSLNIGTTRGCPFKCNWCAKPIYGNRYNSRSPVRVVDEIEMLIKKHGPTHFWMTDDIFGLKPGWVQEFNALVQERGLKFSYNIQSRADLLLKEDTIDAMAQSGIEEIWIGAESGSQKILDAMDKGTKVEQIYEATRLVKAKGVKMAFFLQFGYLGETREDIDKTIEMVMDLMPDNIGVSVSYPLPGTPFYDRVKAELTDKTNWTDSDDLDLMFENTYHPDFYRKLQRYIHHKLRKKQGAENLTRLFTNPLSLNKQRLRSALGTFYYIPAVAKEARQLKKLESAS